MQKNLKLRKSFEVLATAAAAAVAAAACRSPNGSEPDHFDRRLSVKLGYAARPDLFNNEPRLMMPRSRGSVESPTSSAQF